MRTFLCKTEKEFGNKMNQIFFALPVTIREGKLDDVKADIQAYLGQNRRHYPEVAELFTTIFREYFEGPITRAAATGN